MRCRRKPSRPQIRSGRRSSGDIRPSSNPGRFGGHSGTLAQATILSPDSRMPSQILTSRRRPVAGSVLRADVPRAVVIVVAEVPGLAGNNGGRSGHKPRLLAPRASSSYAGAAGERCRSRVRWSCFSTRSASHESCELLQRLRSPNRSAARPAQVEHVPTCVFELGVIKRSRFVQRSAVPEGPRVERCPFDESFQSEALTWHCQQRKAESSDQLPCRET